ncbi:hypothetical protein O3P69_003150 [Scylla paramamosain]|uniref:AB hydrolase-1 domain-containing protein n=1 Tax=Scylla paramamosain TaxID=85552 RepID=A0AAW0UJE0_SCYPA
MGGTFLSVVVVVVAVLLGKGGRVAAHEPPVVRTPHHHFAQLSQLGYPWEPHYLLQRIHGLPLPLRVHYIDEGPHDAPETLLLLHGTPSWSFLYRKVVPGLLAAGYRVVAPDHIGFGRSDKLTDPNAYSHEMHVTTVLQLLKELDLKGVTLIAHDLGGPTGVSAMARDPSRFRRVVLLNTWLPQGDIFSSFFRASEHAPYLAFRGLVQSLGRQQSVETVFRVASKAPRDAISHGYGAPFPSYLYQAGPAWWPLLIPLTKDDPMAREMQKAALFLLKWGGPALIAYSDGELFTLPGKALLQRVLPQACEAQIPDAGHFLQEDQGPLISRLIITFIKRGCSPESRSLTPEL